jgi:hypothetical protein
MFQSKFCLEPSIFMFLGMYLTVYVLRVHVGLCVVLLVNLLLFLSTLLLSMQVELF